MNHMPTQGTHHRQRPSLVALFLLIAAVFVAGCQSIPPASPAASGAAETADPRRTESLVLREGDDLRISFPGAPNLDTTQRVRTDGRVTLSMVGEVVAAGMSPADFEKKLLDLYANELISKEVQVMVISSTFTVFVSGAVAAPGKIVSDHRLTVLEAVMEAGGFAAGKAEMRAVRVVRTENGETKNFVVNLKLAFEDGRSEPFYLKQADIVFVPEKFSWF